MLSIEKKAKTRMVFRDWDSDLPFVMNLFLVI